MKAGSSRKVLQRRKAPRSNGRKPDFLRSVVVDNFMLLARTYRVKGPSSSRSSRAEAKGALAPGSSYRTNRVMVRGLSRKSIDEDQWIDNSTMANRDPTLT